MNRGQKHHIGTQAKGIAGIWVLIAAGIAAADEANVHGAAAPEQVRDIVARIADERGGFEQAVQALRLLGPGTVDSLELVIADPAPGMREAALALLGRLGEGAVPALVRALAAEDAATRGDALRALGDMGDVATEATDAVVQATRDGDREVRRMALHVLGKIGNTDGPVLETLQRGIEDPDQRISIDAALTTLTLGIEPAAPAFDVLRSALGTEHHGVLAGVARIHDVPRVLPFVAEAVSHRDPRIAKEAIGILERWGRRASAAVPELTAALSDTRPEVAEAAAGALAEVDGAAWDAAFAQGDARSRRALAASLVSRSPRDSSRRATAFADPDADVRAAAARHASPADARDHGLLDRPDTRIEAAEAMLRRAETLDEAIAALGIAIGEPGDDRLRALRVLHDALGQSLMMALREASHAGDDEAPAPDLLRTPTVVASAAAVDALRAALGDPDADTVALAAECLGFIGAPARRAIPELAAARGHESRRLRASAAATLAVLGAPQTPTPPDEQRAAELWSRVEALYLDSDSVAVDVTFSAGDETSGATVRRRGSHLRIATDGRGAMAMAIDDHTLELGDGSGAPGRVSPASAGASREVMQSVLQYGVAGTLMMVAMGGSSCHAAPSVPGRELLIMTRERDEVVGGRPVAVLEIVTAADPSSHRVFVDPADARILRHELRWSPERPPLVESYRDAR